MPQKLSKYLQQLKAANQDSFEDLIAKLLEKLTGRHFYLAKSGSQEGRDMSSRSSKANIVAVECKRYGQSTSLDKRELLGELSEVKRSIPDLDLWVLATTKAVSSQLLEALNHEAQEKNVEVLMIADGDGDISSLETLCANAPDVVCSFLKDEDSTNISKILLNIQSHEDYPQKLEDLQHQLTSPLVGYDNWKQIRKSHFIECLNSEYKSRSEFGQRINLCEDTINYIPRSELNHQLDHWYESWNKSHDFLAIVGEEGDGKTWGIASWINIKIEENPNFPAVIFVPAFRASQIPLELLSLELQAGISSEREKLQTRISRWKDKSSTELLILLILDGINERHDFAWWKQLIDRLSIPGWRNHIAVLITCRQGFWTPSQHHRTYIKEYELKAYNAEELEVALRLNQLSRDSIADSLFPLITKPRYFDLLVKHRVQMSNSGDVTVPRLIYEDWKDRLERKNEQSLSDEDFQSFIRDLAEEKLSQHNSRISQHKLKQVLPSDEEKKALRDLRTGGILNHNNRGTYTVNENFLSYGLGLVLIDILEQAEEQDSNLIETIQQWLEPEIGIDFSFTLHFASFLALKDDDISHDVRTALLFAWTTRQNLDKSLKQDFISYFPISPKTYFQLAEIVWTDSTNNPWVQELLMHSFLHWAETPHLQSQLARACDRWLSFVHILGSPLEQNNREKEKDAINNRVGLYLETGAFEFEGYQFIAIDDDRLMRLSRVALGIISFLPKEPFIKAIVLGCLAEAIMGDTGKYDIFRWILSTAREPIFPLIQKEYQKLSKSQNRTVSLALHRVLGFIDSPEAINLQKLLPNDILPINFAREEHHHDPCTSLFSWTKDDCEQCMTRSDISSHFIAQKVSHFCLDPEFNIPESLKNRLKDLLEVIDTQLLWSTFWTNRATSDYNKYEAILCRFSPSPLSRLVHQTFLGISNRLGEERWQLSFEIKNHSIVLGESEMSQIRRAWQTFETDEDENTVIDRNLEDRKKLAEAKLFQFTLNQFNGDDQLETVVSRNGLNLVEFEPRFKMASISKERIIEMLNYDDISKMKNFLWFVSQNHLSIPLDAFEESIFPLLHHSHSFIRSLVLQLIFRVGESNLAQKFLESAWKWSDENHDAENYWGSKLLCFFGEDLSYSEIIDKVHPCYRSFVIQARGIKDDEVQIFSDELEAIWSDLCTYSSEIAQFSNIEVLFDSHSNFPLLTSIIKADHCFSRSVNFVNENCHWGGVIGHRDIESLQDYLSGASDQRRDLAIKNTLHEQKGIQNYFAFSPLSIPVLLTVIQKNPSLKEKLLQPVEPECSYEKREIIGLCGVLYDSLYCTLLQTESEKAGKLGKFLRKLEKRVKLVDIVTQIPFIDIALFEQSRNEELERLWSERFEEALSDQELMEIVLAAQCGGNTKWLETYTKEKLASDIPLDFS